MAKGNRGQHRNSPGQFRSAPYHLPSCSRDMSGNLGLKKSLCDLDGWDWKDATCSVCMEFPHNAVLLLCSSHNKGCRPYMCGTSFRYANCLDQFKKAYTKVSSSNLLLPQNDLVENPTEVQGTSWNGENHEAMELACPLCRGQVKGWTVVEPARAYLNEKKRSCMQDCCSFVGNYKELRKHVRAKHPSARPREVDPILEQKWRRLECERDHDRDDVISTIRSTMPGAMVFGDYMIEGNNYGFDVDNEGGFNGEVTDRNGGFEVGFDSNLMNIFLLLHAFGSSNNGLSRRMRQSDFSQESDETAIGLPSSNPHTSNDSIDPDSDNNNGDSGLSMVARLRRHGRLILGRSGRRRRRRERNESPI